MSITSTSVEHRSEPRWRVVGLLALGLMMAFIDRTSLSATLAERSFIGQFRLNRIARGWLHAAFFWPGVDTDGLAGRPPRRQMACTLWCAAAAAIFAFLLLGAASTLVLLRPAWAPRVVPDRAAPAP